MDQKEGLRRCACRWHFRRQPLICNMSRLRLVAAQGSYKKATRLDRCTQRAKSTSNQASRSLAISGRGFRSSWQQVTFKSGDRKTLRRQPIEQRLYLLDDRQHLRRRAICSRIISTKAKPSRAAASCSLRCCSMRCCSATRSASSHLMTPGINSSAGPLRGPLGDGRARDASLRIWRRLVALP
jgi:hypothetical protein